MRNLKHGRGASPVRRAFVLAAIAAAFPLLPGPGVAQQGRSAPATGFVYVGDATLGQPWSTRNFDNLSRSDTPVFRGTDFADLSLQVGDTLRARSAVNVRARPWATQPEEPPVVGTLPAGTRVVVRDVHWVGLAPGLRRSAFWIEFERM
jgi:hypothetical protein